MPYEIKDSTHGYFDTTAVGSLPHGRRRRLTVEERRERGRGYVRACRTKQARAKIPSSAVVGRALLLALVEISDGRDRTATVADLVKRMHRLLAEAGYDHGGVNDRLDRVTLHVRRNP